MIFKPAKEEHLFEIRQAQCGSGAIPSTTHSVASSVHHCIIMTLLCHNSDIHIGRRGTELEARFLESNSLIFERLYAAVQQI
jgi:hypothetical protein